MASGVAGRFLYDAERFEDDDRNPRPLLIALQFELRHDPTGSLRHVPWCEPIEGVRQHVVAKLVRLRQASDCFSQAQVLLRHDLFYDVPYPKTASSRSVATIDPEKVEPDVPVSLTDR